MQPGTTLFFQTCQPATAWAAKNRKAVFLVALISIMIIASPAAFAQVKVNYGDFAGIDVAFLSVTETNHQPPPEPAALWGLPAVRGNGMQFYPQIFSATSVGGVVDQAGSQLQMRISAAPPSTLDLITIDEFGDIDLSGVGTGQTGTFASMSGFVTVTETTGGPIAPEIIPFTGIFIPTELSGLPNNLGQSLWQGNVVVDIAAVVPNATNAMLSFDDDLTASSDDAGTTALIQKKVILIQVTVGPAP